MQDKKTKCFYEYKDHYDMGIKSIHPIYTLL